MKSFQKCLLGFAVLFLMGLCVKGGDAWAQGNTFDITPKADIKIGFYMAKWSGENNLHIELRLKNLSNQKERFKATIDLVDGPSVIAYIPIAGNPMVIQPNAEVTGVYPIFYGQFPKGFDLKVEVVPAE